MFKLDLENTTSPKKDPTKNTEHFIKMYVKEQMIHKEIK
jgi:hypothetical protein